MYDEIEYGIKAKNKFHSKNSRYIECVIFTLNNNKTIDSIDKINKLEFCFLFKT